MEKKKKWIITGVILLVILIFGVGIYWYTRPKEVTSYTPEFETSQTKKESEKNTGNVEAGIQIPGYKTIIVAAGTKERFHLHQLRNMESFRYRTRRTNHR